MAERSVEKSWLYSALLKSDYSHRALAVMIAPRPASKSGDLSSSSRPPLCCASSQPTPRTTASAWKTKAAPLAERLAAAALSFFSPRSAIDVAPRAHQSRRLSENSYVTANC